ESIPRLFVVAGYNPRSAPRSCPPPGTPSRRRSDAELSEREPHPVTTSRLPDWLPRRLMTVDEVAELMHQSSRQVWRLIAAGKLPVVRVGRSARITPEALAALLGFSD